MAGEERMVERVAAALWRAEATDAGVPRSVADGRTIEAFRDQSEQTQTRWVKLARAGIAAMREPTEEMWTAGKHARWNIEGGYGGPTSWEAMIDAALAKTPT